MKIAVRLDDITPDMDWEKFRRLEKILDENKIAPLIGVVPNNQDPNLMRNEKMPNFAKQIKLWEEKEWVLAMHGWKHIYTTKQGGLFPLNDFSEFAGVPREKQRSMILDGKEKLQTMGINTDIFMAPAHSYDTNTLSMLKEASFRYITDGFGDYPYEWKGLTFLPIAFQRSKDVKRAEGYTTLVFHTNTMSEQEFVGFEKMVEEHKDDFVSYKEFFNAPVVKQTWIKRMEEYSKAIFKRTLVKIYTKKKSANA